MSRRIKQILIGEAYHKWAKARLAAFEEQEKAAESMAFLAVDDVANRIRLFYPQTVDEINEAVPYDHPKRRLHPNI